MSTAQNLMEIKEADIDRHRASAQAMLEGFDHAPRSAASDKTQTVRGGIELRMRRPTIPGMGAVSTGAAARRVEVMKSVLDVTPDDPLASPAQNELLRTLRRSLSVAAATVDLYGDMTALNKLKEANKRGALSEVQRVEFAELLNSASLIAIFTFASHAQWSLGDLLPDADAVQVAVSDPQEIVLDNPVVAIQGALWEISETVKAHARDDVTLVRAVKEHLAKLIAEIQIHRTGAKHLDGFLANSYRVAKDDFTISGFDVKARGRSSQLVMTFKRPDEVIGNHIAKYQALKLSKMLMAYDFGRQMNPFVDLGGFIFTFMGDGFPGTGKTTLIQMMAGLLNDYCAAAGYPFRYANFSTDQISSYQGQSGNNAKQFINQVIDPHVIGFGTIDDIDQVAGKRGDKQSSAGQQEVTAVLMESFAGANTVVRGNCTFGMFSNYPENVDDALRQRAGLRMLVDGPKTLEDYIDILALLLGKRHQIPLGEVELFSTQNIKKVIGASFAQHDLPQEEKLRAVYDRVVGRAGKLDTVQKLGTYLKAIQEADARFTGRAIKNITDAVKVRAMDFEIPDEWMENPEHFLARDYETKRQMISELMTPITVDMVIQEINRYADSEFRYAGKSDEVEISRMMRHMDLEMQARARLADQLKSRG
mgnify:CR=1 FL=1